MRTKTLLLTAALAAVGLVSAHAQTTVYSVNAVGFVNLNLVAGYTLICNPLNGTNNDNHLSKILPAVPDSTLIVKWNPATQRFFAPAVFIDPDGWSPDLVLNPGEGAFISVDSPTTVTFVGEVPQGSLSNNIPANYSMLSQLVPQTNGLAATGFPATDSDLTVFWNPATQRYKLPIVFVDPDGWSPSDPSPAVGEGFFYFNNGSARTWTRTFNVNTP